MNDSGNWGFMKMTINRLCTETGLSRIMTESVIIVWKAAWKHDVGDDEHFKKHFEAFLLNLPVDEWSKVSTSV